MIIRSLLSSIMGSIGLEQQDLFALYLQKIDELDFIYTLVSTDINQLAQNLLKMYVTKRSRVSLIVASIRRAQSELSTLGLEKLP